MEKMLFFAKILSEELRKAYEVFYYAGYKLLSFSSEYPTYTEYIMHGGTKLRMKDKQYVVLESLDEDMDLQELLFEIYTGEECEANLEEYLADYEDKEIEKVVGILFPNDFLYEVLYDYGMLGDEFGDEEKDGAVKELLRKVYKIAGAFNLDLHFLDGRIVITGEKKPLDDGSFICETMAEVEAVCKLQKGASLMDAREASGMSEDEFRTFRERLKQHEWKQTSAGEE